MFLYRRHKKLDKPATESHIGDRRTHLANERTLLAWIRTSVTIMAFGFVVEKFSLFLWLNLNSQRYRGSSSLAVSNLLGIIFMGLGAFIGLLSLVRFVRVEKEIETNTFRPSIVMDVLCGLIFFTLSAIILYYVLNWHNLAILEYTVKD